MQTFGQTIAAQNRKAVEPLKYRCMDFFTCGAVLAALIGVGALIVVWVGFQLVRGAAKVALWLFEPQEEKETETWE